VTPAQAVQWALLRIHLGGGVTEDTRRVLEETVAAVLRKEREEIAQGIESPATTPWNHDSEETCRRQLAAWVRKRR
jgi:uncharacterized membrane protein YdbT with pleckstrin-like domain